MLKLPKLELHVRMHGSYHVSMFHHYTDVTMSPMGSQITSLVIVYATIYSGADQRKHQSSASLAFVRGIHRGPGKRGKCFHLMTSSWHIWARVWCHWPNFSCSVISPVFKISQLLLTYCTSRKIWRLPVATTMKYEYHLGDLTDTFSKIKNNPHGEINGWSFSTHHPRPNTGNCTYTCNRVTNVPKAIMNITKPQHIYLWWREIILHVRCDGSFRSMLREGLPDDLYWLG